MTLRARTVNMTGRLLLPIPRRGLRARDFRAREVAVVVPGTMRPFGHVVIAIRKDEVFQDLEQLEHPREAMGLGTADGDDLATQASVVIP
jgi:hypothetical protein